MKTKIFTCFALLFISTLFGQNNTKFIDTVSIDYQFDTLIKNASPYLDSRVVKTNAILQLKSNIITNISVDKKALASALYEINLNKNTIDSLKTVLNTADETILQLKDETQSISFIGIEFNNRVFKTMLLSIIAILIILLIYFISKFKQSNSITTQTLEEFRVLEEEFDTHRKNALEREQKVRRELLDEINKHKNDS